MVFGFCRRFSYQGGFKQTSTQINPMKKAIVSIAVSTVLALSTQADILVIPTNLPPTISAIAHRRTLVNTATPEIHFTVGDMETAPTSLTVSASSSNPVLAPPTGITLGRSGADRTVAIVTGLHQTGTAVITVSVSDGAKMASSTFVLMVVAVPEVVLQENFDYPNGSLITNSAYLWVNHSGTVGQLAVGSGNVTVSSRQSEDVHADFPDGPYSTSSGVVLYSSFKLRCGETPLSNGEYFANLFGSTAGLRCRIFASITNAAPGTFRLGIANGSANYTQSTVDL